MYDNEKLFDRIDVVSSSMPSLFTICVLFVEQLLGMLMVCVEMKLLIFRFQFGCFGSRALLLL